MLGNITPHSGFFSEQTFERSVIEMASNLERVAEKAAKECTHPKPLMFFDRGIPDAESYIEEPGLYEKILCELGLGSKVEVRDRRYKGVFHLRTAALGAEAFYTTANNTVRRESSLQEARMKDECPLQVWNGHPHLRVIDNSTDFAGKLARLDREICSLLGVPVPLEIEKKFLCAPPTAIPVPMQRIEIEQVYLYSSDPSVVMRVRKRGQFGSFVYFKTEKRDVRPGVRVETEHFITAEEYECSVRFQLPGTRIIKKDRYCFIYENQYFEFDRIPHDSGSLYLLEIELTEMTHQPRLPPFLRILRDVTDDPHYTNRAIAELSWRP